MPVTQTPGTVTTPVTPTVTTGNTNTGTTVTTVTTVEPEPETLTVSFVTNCQAKVESLEVQSGSQIEEPTVTNSGYDLLGWYTNSHFGIKYNFDTEVTSNLKLYARWEKHYEDSIGFEYELSNDGKYYSITGKGSATGNTIVVPRTYNNLPVKRISSAGLNNLSCTELIIRDNIEEIEVGALNGISNLTTLQLPFISDKKSDCTVYKLCCLFGKTQYQNSYAVTINSNSSHLDTEKGTFYVPTSLTTLFVDGTTEIANQALDFCDSLTSLRISSTVTFIDAFFGGYHNIRTLYYDGDINAFAETARIDKKLTPYLYDYSKTEKGQGDVSYGERIYSAITDVILDEDCHKIAESVFSDLTINNLYIPSTITNYCDDAFYSTKISNLYYGGNEDSWLKNIFTSVASNPASANKVYFADKNGEISFNNMKFSEMKSFSIPNTAESINNYAFAGMKLENIYITKNSFEHAKECAFVGSKLDNIYYDGSLDDFYNDYASIATENSSIFYENSKFYYKDNDGVETFNKKSFTQLTSPYIPTDATIVPAGIYKNFSTSNDTVVIPSGVTSIGKYVFSTMKGLRNIVIPNSVVNLGSSCFGVKNGNHVALYFNGTFDEWCKIQINGLEAISTNVELFIKDSNGTIENMGEHYSRITIAVVKDNADHNLYGYKFRYFTQFTGVTVEDGIKFIGNNSLDDMGQLDYLELPRVFACSSYFNNTTIENIYYNGTIEDWAMLHFTYESDNPIRKARYLNVLDDNGTIEHNNKKYKLVSTVDADNKIEILKDYAFTGYSELKSFLFNENTEIVGKDPFNECDNLQFNEFGNCKYLGSKNTSYFYLDSYKDGKIIISKDCKFINASILKNSFRNATKVFFEGTKEEYIERFEKTPSSNFYFYSKTKPETEGKYWHYNTKGEVIIWDFSNDSECSFEKNGNDYYLTSYDGEDGNVTLPTVVVILNVTITKYVIAEGAFENSEGVYSVTIPASVEKISTGAFKNSKDLREVIIESGLTVIENNAFEDCKALETVVIPESVTEIGKDVFKGCNALKEITVPFIGAKVYAQADVKQYPLGYFFGEEAFEGAEETEQTFVGENGDATKTYYIPKSLTIVNVTGTSYIQKGAFENCRYIFIINISIEIIIIGNNAFKNCVGLRVTSITADSNLTSIGAHAFEGCSNLLAFLVPSKVTSIGEDAFNGCTKLSFVNNLSSLNIVAGETTNGKVGYYAVAISTDADNPNLKLTDTSLFININGTWQLELCLDFSSEIELPKQIDLSSGNISEYIIGEDAFVKHEHIDKLIVPNSVIRIIGNAGLNNKKVDGVEHNNGIYLCNDQNQYLVLIGYVNINVSRFVIDDNCKHILEGALEGFNVYRELVLPNGIKFLPDGLFSSTDGLTRIYYGGDITDFARVYGGNNSYDSKWLYLYSYDEPTTPGQYWHYDNNGHIIEWDKETSYFTVDNKYEFKLEAGKLTLTKVLVSSNDIRLPKAVEYNGNTYNEYVIGACAFDNVETVEKIIIPEAVIEIDYLVFYNITITTIYYGGSESSWKTLIIGNYNDALENVKVLYYSEFKPASDLSKCWRYDNQNNPVVWTIKLIKTFTYGDYSFRLEDDNLYLSYYNGTSATPELPLEVTYDNVSYTSYNIAEQAFYDKTFITSIIIPDFVKMIGKYAFAKCTSLTSIKLSANLVMIQDDAFGNCSSLENVELPSSLKTIGAAAFIRCNKLVSAVIPEGVTRIETNTYYGDSELQYVVIPKTIKFIGGWAFSDATNIKSVYYNGTVADWLNITIGEYGGSPMYFSHADMYIYDEKGPVTLNGLNYKLLSELVIPEGVTEIKENQFMGFDGYKVVFPASLKKVGRNAFYNCDSVLQVFIYGKIEEVEMGSIQFTSIYEVYNLGGTDLITLGDIEYGHYCNLSHARTTHYSLDDESLIWANGDFVFGGNSKILIGESGISLIKYVGIDKKITLPINFEHNGNVVSNYSMHAAFQNNKIIEEVIIPEGITYISIYAFKNCINLKKVTLPNTIRNIEAEAFYNTGIEEIYLPNGIETVNGSSFTHSSSLRLIFIPSSVTNITDQFYGVADHFDVYYGGSVTEYTSHNLTINSTQQGIEIVVHFYSESEPTTTGNYWHYVDGKITNW